MNATSGPSGSRTRTVGAKVRDLLDEHPELASKPTEIVRTLAISLGSAKREAKAWRDAQKLSRLGPILLQNIRFFTRTTPGTTWSGSSPPGWQDRGDNKLTRTVDLPPDGHMDVCWAPSGGAEITMAAPRGLTPSEVLQALSFAGNVLPLDPDFMGTLSYEALRDGGSLRLEGVEGVTLRTLESILIKAYRHSDKRGEMLRTEVRPPPVKATLREVEAMLLDRRPLGRDDALERVALQTEENTRAILMMRKEWKLVLERIDRSGSR